MKKFVKILVAILVVAVVGMSVVSLAACSDSKTLTMVTNADFPPFEMFDRHGVMVGFDVDYVKAIAEVMGVKVDFKHMDFDGIIGEIQNKPNFIGVAGMTVNEKRKKQVNFTESYFQSYQVYIVTADDTTFDNCKTKEEADEVAKTKSKMYAAVGQVGQYYVNGNGEEYVGLGGDASALPTINECIRKVTKDTSFAIADVTVAKEIVSKVSGYKVIEIPLTNEQYAIGVNKKNTELLDKLNAAIKTLNENGTAATLKLKWLQG